MTIFLVSDFNEFMRDVIAIVLGNDYALRLENFLDSKGLFSIAASCIQDGNWLLGLLILLDN